MHKRHPGLSQQGRFRLVKFNLWLIHLMNDLKCIYGLCGGLLFLFFLSAFKAAFTL